MSFSTRQPYANKMITEKFFSLMIIKCKILGEMINKLQTLNGEKNGNLLKFLVVFTMT